MERRIIIYRDQILPYSETFIPAQVENFKSYQGIYVGTALINRPKNIPSHRRLILEEKTIVAPLWKPAFKVVGVIHPAWLKQIQHQSPCLIHAHFGLDGVLALPLASTLKIPLIVTFHGYYATVLPDASLQQGLLGHTIDFLQRRGQFYRNLYFRRRQFLFHTATCLVAVSDFIRQALIVQGCPSDKIYRHYIGVDWKQFAATPTCPREPIVLFVGRLVEKKGCEYLIRAMAQVQAQYPTAELVVLGDGIRRSPLESLAAQLLKRYRFEGAQPPDQVRQWMQRARVLAAPSVTTAQQETEGLPIVILEAMASGLPVVSTVHAGIPEAVSHEETGYLALERDVDAIAAYILTLLQDNETWQRMAIAGQERIKQHFDLKRNTQQLEALYTHVLQSN